MLIKLKMCVSEAFISAFISTIGLIHRLYLKMVNMTAPQKWGQSVSIATWWPVAVVIADGTGTIQIHFSQRWLLSFSVIQFVYVSFFLVWICLNLLTELATAAPSPVITAQTLAPYTQDDSVHNQDILASFLDNWKCVVHLYFQSIG